VEILPQNSIIIEVDGLTEGAACTMLLSKNIINCDDELIIANSDQWIDWSSEHFLNFMRRKNADAGILTFQAHEEKWSYAKVENQNKVIEVAEKKPISTNATVGVYFSKKGSDFVKYAERMIDKNIRTNNEFYVCPVFNEYLIDNKNIYIYPVPEMHGIGTPEDLDKFLKIYK
jgi:NDP-sugar pyrophosphorylase family protein